MSSSRRSRNTSRATHIEAHANDVLSGRGVKIAQHDGNIRFRSLVRQLYDKDYCETFSSSEKKALAWKIIDHVKKKLKPPGRFLKKNGDGSWIELSKAETEKKTKQALRDCSRPDREGYAKQVKAPQDVDKVDMERKRSGLSVQEYARKQINDQSRRGRTRDGNNNNQKPLPTPGTASRPSRRSTQGGMSLPIAAESIASHRIRDSRTPAPLEHPYHQQSAEAAVAVSSTTSSWPAHSTGSATPAVRPNIGPTPVTNTPNAPHFSYLQENDHEHHLINHGSQPAINGHQVASYNDHYPTRVDFVDHHAGVRPGIARLPSPIVRSPIVSSNSRGNQNVFEEQPEPFLEDWNTKTLFPPEDPLDSLAASASNSLVHSAPPPGVDDFTLGFGITSDVTGVPDGSDLHI